jgi:hypothetical protein
VSHKTPFSLSEQKSFSNIFLNIFVFVKYTFDYYITKTPYFQGVHGVTLFDFCVLSHFSKNSFSCVLKYMRERKPHKYSGHCRRETGGLFIARKRREERSMMKITPKQVEKVHRLVRELCANCDEDGNCILLDDGEAHRCVQLISIYGIYCNYFKEAVLPSDRELYEQIKKINKLK